MTNETSPSSSALVRLAPMVLRARVAVAGRERLARLRKRLCFILITMDLTENSRNEILRCFPTTPIVQTLHSDDIERLFGFHGTKVLGFLSSSLATNVLKDLKDCRIRVHDAGSG